MIGLLAWSVAVCAGCAVGCWLADNTEIGSGVAAFVKGRPYTPTEAARLVFEADGAYTHTPAPERAQSARHPLPADPHATVSDLAAHLIGQPLSVAQADLVVQAMREAIDGINPTSTLLQLAATPVADPKT